MPDFLGCGGGPRGEGVLNGIHGRCFLIVGAYSAIGRATARKLAGEGGRIVGVGRKEDALRAVLDELPGEGHEAVVADAAVWEQLQPAIQFGKQAHGFAGGVVCAGLHEMRPLAVLDAQALARSFEANVTSAILSTRALAKVASKEGCSMVWLSSVAALRGTPAFGAYAAAKGALISAARVMAVELAARRIRVNVVAVGVVQSAMSQGWTSLLTEAQKDELAKKHLLGIGQPDDVADVIAFLLSDRARWMTGSTLTVDGGLSAH